MGRYVYAIDVTLSSILSLRQYTTNICYYCATIKHWTIWGAPFKIKILKIGLRSDLKWPKLGLEPKFHEPGTFGGFGKREQTDKPTRFMFYKYRLH